MASPTTHAVCSASSAERWLHCTAAPRFEEQFPASVSDYAAEGTLAHSVCELLGRKHFTTLSRATYNKELKKLKENPYWQDEMLTAAETYVQYLTEKANTFTAIPHVTQEVRVDLTEYVPEGFGTCDCVMIGGDRIHITDYKHGKGVRVSADHNSQMMLYALGALNRYAMVYGDSIKQVSMAIIQPRISDEPSEFSLTVDELLEWGESIKPLAQKAYAGLGDFVPGDWCRFCRGKERCRARAEYFMSLEAATDSSVPLNALTHEEIGNLLSRGSGLVDWYNDLREYALQTILKGGAIPGYKVVAGRSNRAFSDADAAFEALKAAGYNEAILYDRKPKTLSELEKIIGAKYFGEVVGNLIVKPTGKPTLTEVSDARPEINRAALDFAGIDEGGKA